MTRVLVVCAAGASSTFLARRLAALATDAGLDWDVSPMPVDSLAHSTADVVAVTAHVSADAALESLSERGIDFVVLPEHVQGGFGAEDALSAIVDFVGKDGGRTDSKVGSEIWEGSH